MCQVTLVNLNDTTKINMFRNTIHIKVVARAALDELCLHGPFYTSKVLVSDP